MSLVNNADRVSLHADDPDTGIGFCRRCLTDMTGGTCDTDENGNVTGASKKD